MDISTLKLRFIIRMLSDMEVCEIDFLSDDIFEFEVCKNAQKSNLELTRTYKMLESQCRG